MRRREVVAWIVLVTGGLRACRQGGRTPVEAGEAPALPQRYSVTLEVLGDWPTDHRVDVSWRIGTVDDWTSTLNMSLQRGAPRWVRERMVREGQSVMLRVHHLDREPGRKGRVVALMRARLGDQVEPEVVAYEHRNDAAQDTLLTWTAGPAMT